MSMPGYRAPASLYRTSNRYQSVHSSDHGRGLSTISPQLSLPPYDICYVAPWLCWPPPQIQVTWPHFPQDTQGFVLVHGSNFSKNSPMMVQISDCVGIDNPPFFPGNTDDKGEFTASAMCNCDSQFPVSPVQACDANFNCAYSSAKLTC
jgi:hypothetical protein